MIMESGHTFDHRPLPFRWSAATDTGKIREQNEDKFLVNQEIGLFIISDGMGGHQGGELASKIVVEDLPYMIENGLHRLRAQSVRSVRGLLKKTITELNRQMVLEAESESGYKGMGATLVLALFCNQRTYVANLGDSRMYLLRDGRLKQRTRDHSVVGTMVRNGEITPEEATDHEAQGQITRYVGMEEKARAYVRTFQVKSGDRYLLCSDGLTDMIDEKMIAKTLDKVSDGQEACKQLVAAANTMGGHDNITVVIIDWLE
jgi:PPM family protein phosphatase